MHSRPRRRRRGGPAPPQPTLPSGKLPQYELGDYASETEAGESDAIRFWLNLPGRPLLLEATVRIDGRPFRSVREERVQTILRQLSQSEPAADAPRQRPVAPAPDESAAADSADDSADESAPSENVVAYNPPTTALEQVRRYLAATGRAPSPQEVRWLLAQRIDGPRLLLIKQPFQAYRADQMPAFAILDRDRDGVLSRSEIDSAVRSFQECDLNRDDIVDFREIAVVAKDPRQSSEQPGLAPRLLVLTDENDAEPDLCLAVSFDTGSPENSTISITGIRAPAADAAPLDVQVRDARLLLRLADSFLELTAVQSSASDQVSIGAVDDGYPLLPALDLHDDGRFTIRELRSLVERLREFDRDGDGTIARSELRRTIRLCVGLGPLVHRELAGVRSVHRPPTEPPRSGPEWFVRMDRNKDNDLTRGEFPGTDEQFARLDADSDELISADEANRFEAKNQSGTGDRPGPNSSEDE